MQINQRIGLTIVLLPLTAALLWTNGAAFLRVWDHGKLPKFSEGEIRARVSVGMSEEEVNEVLGASSDRIESDGRVGVIYKNNPPQGYPTTIIVIFRDGQVAEMDLSSPRIYRPPT